jgi:mycothiol synthase
MIATLEPTTFALELNIQGLTLRNWRDDSDYEKMLRVLYADKHAQGLEEAIPLHEFKTHIESLPHLDVTTDVFLLERDGEVIAYKNLRGYPEASGTYCYNHHGFILPEWKGRGIGRAMIRHSEQVAREIAKRHPADAPKFFQVFIESKQTDLASLLDQEGYVTERYFYQMLRPNLANIPEYELPAGIEIRAVQPEHMHKIWQADVEMFKEHWGETEHGEDDYERWLKRSYIQPRFWHVAWDRDRIVGLVLNYVDEADNAEYNRKRGQTDDIGTLKDYRGRGIAKALIARGLRQFRDLGYTEATLDVDSENGSGALRLYEKLGYRPIKTVIAYRKPL